MNSKKARDIVLRYLYLYGELQLLLVREILEHDNHDINIQKNDAYKTLLMFLLSILSQLALVNKSHGNIVNFMKSMFLM